MKILYITPISPYESYSGGGVRSRLLYDALKAIGEVHVSIVQAWGEREKSPLESEDKNIRRVAPLNYEPTVWWRGLLEGTLFLMTGCDLRQYPNKEALLNQLGWSGESFDVVVARFAWMATNVGAWRIAPLYIDIDDLPSEDFKTVIRPKMSVARGIVRSMIVRLWERIAFRRAAGMWVVNSQHLGYVKRFGRCEHLPNIVRPVPANFDSGVGKKSRLLTVGSLDYIANTEGVDWFLTNVWSGVLRRWPQMEFAIVGKGLPDELKEKWEKIPGVVLLGFVPDIHLVYAEAMAVVAPVFIGGGTAIKVIEAIAHGQRVFATPFAARGLSAAQKERAHLIEFETADRFVEALEAVLCENEDVKRSCREDALRLASEDFSLQFFQSQVKKLIVSGV